MAVGTSAQAAAQEPRSAVIADTIRVGDVVPVAVRVIVEPGARVLFPDTLHVAGDRLENAATVRTGVDTLTTSAIEATAVYAVTPWRTGTLALPALEVEVVDREEGTRTLSAALPELEVVSVLPADTAGVEPKPAKGVIGRSWSWWPILLALAGLAALVLVLVVWWRRRGRGAEEALVPPLTPRERALAKLQEAREAGLVERGELKAFYSLTSEALREYLAALERRWGEDLTTTELLARVKAYAGLDAARPLRELLRAADGVKFARRRPGSDTAVAEWKAARQWVLDFELPAPPSPPTAPPSPPTPPDREVAA